MKVFWLCVVISGVAISACSAAQPAAQPRAEGQSMLDRMVGQFQFDRGSGVELLHALNQALPVGVLVHGSVQLSDYYILEMKLKNVSVRDVLNAVFPEVSGYAYVVVRGRIVVVSTNKAGEIVLNQRVSIAAKQQTLEQTLRKISAKYDANILLDEAVAKDVRQKKVSLNIRNVRLEEGVVVLAALCDLCAVRIGNCILVTTRERGKQIKEHAHLVVRN